MTTQSSFLGKSYEPKTFENQRYQFWLNEGCFIASDENAPGQKSYSIVIPPPNVTGHLHMGHALMLTLEDILIRWHRMKGLNTLWLPGTDHAGIATQTQVEKQIAKEGKGPSGRPLTRHDLGREKFLERTWKWKEDHHHVITDQMKKMGSALDWSRERFTMDEGLSKAVREVFVRLYDEKLIYRGERIINWCVRSQSALSDLEVIPTDRKGHLWHLQYAIVEKDGTPVKDPATGESTTLTIATTRPETLLGDTAVAVHPDDERFTHIHGKFAVLPLVGRLIPVITDSYVDREFGTGGLKVTPAHDFNDYDLGVRHQLPMIQVMGLDGKITSEGGIYAGLKFAEAREKIVEDLKTAGLLAKVEEHSHKVGLSERYGEVVEPVLSKQWFVKMEPLAKPAIEAARTGKIEFSPKMHEKIYYEWMNNIRDWCISRQLWWGHQIPAWHCADCEGISVGREDPKECEHCHSAKITRDPDVLDTWFSSSLWPFSTLGWPEKTKALETFYPTSVLETGSDILFFWVARMIVMGLHFMGEIPFHKVYLHSMVRDEKGDKMSKSKGNVIDPLPLIEQHGADPLRFTLASMAGNGRDIKLAGDRVENYRAFANKIWNATKFLHLQFDGMPVADGADPGTPPPPKPDPVNEPIIAGKADAGAWLEANFETLHPTNRWILSRLQTAIESVEHGFANWEIDRASMALYEFAWLEFCDWFIEFSKLPLRKGGTQRAESVITLHYTLESLLRLLHPIMPFVTEELWDSLPWRKPTNSPARIREGKLPVATLAFAEFPRVNPKFRDPRAELEMTRLKAVIEAVRNFRGENNLSPKKEFALNVFMKDAATREFFSKNESDILQLAKISAIREIKAGESASKFESVILLTNPAAELRISLEGLVDVGEEMKRLRKEVEKTKVDLAHLDGKLGKESFIAKAPPELIAKTKSDAVAFRLKLDGFEAALKKLGAS
ncbi:MAG: valine--tRNA ligase [Cryobacterium sp.]|nr:valine--tRNA ligase [Oligoflexia bacterium]